MAERKAPAPRGEEPAAVYPAVERFLETQPREAVAGRFDATRSALEALPKPRAEQARRALLALRRTEELLQHLFDTKDALAASPGKKARR